MFNSQQLREYIIRPALQAIHMYSEGAEELLIATCAQESLGGTYLHQSKGCALGIFQMEPATHDDIWNRFCMQEGKEGKELSSLGYQVLKGCRFVTPVPADVMVHNLFYATMMARLFWLRSSEVVLNTKDINNLWFPYKKYWNTEHGAATKVEFLTNYHRFTGIPIPVA